MKDQEAERENTKQSKVRFDPSYNETHLLERDISSASESSTSSADSSIESTLTDKDDSELLTKSTDSSIDLTSQSSPSPGTGRQSGYDPNRIPSSVFNSRPTTPTEWSVASNDSLFSIHMGNNSFSKDHAFLLYKSGELMKLDEVFNLPSALPPVAESLAHERDTAVSRTDHIEQELSLRANNTVTSSVSASEMAVAPGASQGKKPVEIKHPAVSDEAASVKKTKVEESHSKGKAIPEEVRNSASVSAHSDGSGASNSSFAFPILVGNDGKNISNKVEPAKEHPQQSHPLPEEPQPQQENPPTPKTTTLTNWFSCFSCCLFRCSMSLK